MDDASLQTVNLAPAQQQWLSLPQPRMFSAYMWEGGQAARAEVEQILNALRRWLPFLPERDDVDEGLVDTRPKAKQRLKAAFQAASVVDGVNVWRTRLLSSVSVIQFGGVATAAISCLSPQVGLRAPNLVTAHHTGWCPVILFLCTVHVPQQQHRTSKPVNCKSTTAAVVL